MKKKIKKSFKNPEVTRGISVPNTSDINIKDSRPWWALDSPTVDAAAAAAVATSARQRSITKRSKIISGKLKMMKKKMKKNIEKAEKKNNFQKGNEFTAEDLDALPLDWEDLRSQSNNERIRMESKKIMHPERNIREYGIEQFPETISKKKGKIGGKHTRRRKRRKRRKRKSRKTRKKRRRKSRRRRNMCVYR